jgi:hypothetical protein
MRSLVDYSTMSSAIKSTQAYDSSFVPTIDTGFLPLFDLFNSNTLVPAGEGAFFDSMGFPTTTSFPGEASNESSINNLNRVGRNR